MLTFIVEQGGSEKDVPQAQRDLLTRFQEDIARLDKELNPPPKRKNR